MNCTINTTSVEDAAVPKSQLDIDGTPETSPLAVGALLAGPDQLRYSRRHPFTKPCSEASHPEQIVSGGQLQMRLKLTFT